MFYRGNLRQQHNSRYYIRLYLLILFMSDLYFFATGTMKIIGGRLAKKGEFPATVCYNGHIRCGGTLVSLNRIVSAAHCFVIRGKNLNPKSIIIIGGVVNINERSGDKQISYVRNFIIHDKFERRQVIFDISTVYDIAMAYLESPFHVTKTLKPAVFPATDLAGTKKFLDGVRASGARCIATGFGVVSLVGRKKIISDKLKVAELNLLPDNECALEPEMIGYEVCAVSSGHTDRTAPGDSGSTFYCGGHPIGMAKGGSSYIVKGRNMSSSIFTLIGPYMDYFPVSKGRTNFNFHQGISPGLLIYWFFTSICAAFPQL